jgi:hypothetical protein
MSLIGLPDWIPKSERQRQAMNRRELVDQILNRDLAACSIPYEFNDITRVLQSRLLQSSVTIRTVNCRSHREYGISEDKWVLLVQTLGCITGIQNLRFSVNNASHNFRPLQAISNVVRSAHSLRTLGIILNGSELPGGIIPEDPTGLTALTNAIRHLPVLNSFQWLHYRYNHQRLQEAQQHDIVHDTVFQALSSCPKLQKVSIKTTRDSAGAIRKLMQLRSGTILHLTIEADHWMVVADEIRQGRCRLRGLVLSIYGGYSDRATASVKAIATAIRRDDNLEGLFLIMNNLLSNEASVALAEALTVNTKLRVVRLADTDALGAPAYQAFRAMHRVNTNVNLELSPRVTDIGDERQFDIYNQMRIEQQVNSAARGTLFSVEHSLREEEWVNALEQRLNSAGRRMRLSVDQSPREEWVNALHELNATNANESPAFQISCLYSLLRLNPNACLSQLVESTTPALRRTLAARWMRRVCPWRKP